MTRSSGPGRRLGLGTRLALAIGVAVAAVIFAAGVLVEIGVFGRFDAYLAEVRHERQIEVLTVALDLVGERGDLALRPQDLRRLAVIAGGLIVLRDTGGQVVARIDELPGIGGMGGAGTEPPIEIPLVVDGRSVGTLEIVPFATAVEQGTAAAPVVFRETATEVLLAAGLGAVLASIMVAFILARRLTRPLGTLAAAAARVEQGDLSARVPLPGDAESHGVAWAFNSMAESLERSEALRQRAASDLAHELATPVTMLSGRLQALADGVVPADPEHLASARDAAEEVRRLVGDLQDLVAAEGASLRRVPSRVDLRAIAGRAAAASQALFDDAGVVLEVSGLEYGPAVFIDADPRHLERALVNLLTNAACYTPSGGTAVVTVTREGPWARARVRDSGCGIQPEHVEHVFERFYRADSARARDPARPGGTGIGLTVARDLVVANGGTLMVESTSPVGTTLLLELPSAM